MSRVDIIVVTYNAKDKLKACLASIRRHTKRSSYTLTVVDNHSTDGTYGFLKDLGGDMNIIRAVANKGFSYAANVGLKNTSSEYVALVDDDVEVTPGWLDGLSHHLQRRKDAGIVTGKIVFPNDYIFCAGFFLKRMTSLGIFEKDMGQHDAVRECDAFAGPCWLMRRSVVRDVGYFDEKYFPCQYEDIDYCIRARLAGYKIIYDGRIRIIHHNAFRDKDTAKVNRRRFLYTWKNVLKELPFKDSAAGNKLVEKGLDFINKRDNGRAIRCFLQAEKRYGLPIGPYYMAYYSYKEGKWGKAMDEFEKAINTYEPDSYPYRIAVYYLRILYKKLGMGQKTIDLIEKLRGENS